MNITYHNPEGLSGWGQSDGWRLLTTEEKILPDDAEITSAGEWVDSRQRGEKRNECITYRTKKPLPVSQLIAQLDAEIKALEEKKAIALAVEAGAEWEHVGGGAWYTPEDQSLEQLRNIMSYGHEVRLKPKPVTRPWTSNDVPLTCYVRRKGFTESRLTVTEVATWGVLASNMQVGFRRLYEDYEHTTPELNGEWKPCETKAGLQYIERGSWIKVGKEEAK